MAAHAFDTAIALQPLGDGRFTGNTSPAYANMVGPFGGVTAATALNAVLEEGDIIYVPANPLAAVGLALQQVLLPIQPAASVVKGPTDIDSTSRGAPYTSTAGIAAAP